MSIVSVEPFSLPCRTALAEPDSTKMTSFLPTIGCTLKVSGAGVAALGFSSARAVPEPANELLQTLALLISASSDLVHAVRPLVESLSVLGKVILICFAVVLLAGLLTTLSLSVSALGLDLVPALVGDTLAVTSMLGAGFWA